jgi:hypothetical protein
MSKVSVARLTAALVMGLALSGCKGSGGSGGSVSIPTATPPPPVTPPPVTPPPPPPPPPVTPPPPGANRAPVVTGTPATSATVGSTYEFRPSASDPDGDAITFEIRNKPAWASFDAATGRLSGKPVDTDIGAYASVVIVVSDGKTTASLAPFTLTVAAIRYGAAMLTWEPPTENTDGTTLDDLAGFRIRYGRDPGELSTVESIPNAGITSAVVERLATGVWYFSVTAYNRGGVESQPSNLVQKTVM